MSGPHDGHAHDHSHDHAHDHSHDHSHHHFEGSHLSTMDLRVRALESLLTEKGYVDPAALDAIIETYEHRIGPRNGAHVVARCWSDPDFRRWALEDATAAIHSLGYRSRQGEHMAIVECTRASPEKPGVHHMVVCTLCSCYPWSVLGLPPAWYKSPAYRAKAVIDPRGTLADFGVTLPKDTAVEVHDSTSELRYLVLPLRPAGTDGWSEEALAAIVSRDAMIGTALVEPQ